jgi:hypothetical protein
VDGQNVGGKGRAAQNCYVCVTVFPGHALSEQEESRDQMNACAYFLHAHERGVSVREKMAGREFVTHL